MPHEDIPRDGWQSFCDSFSRQHHGWLVRMQVMDTRRLDESPAAAEAEARVLITNMVLQGITAEGKGSNIAITITAGHGPHHAMHRVRKPVRIRLEHDPGGAHKGLRIDAATGETTLVRFRASALPETLDGMTEAER